MKKLLQAKAIGIVKSIQEMPGDHRTGPPTLEFGTDYNKLLQITKESYPVLGSVDI